MRLFLLFLLISANCFAQARLNEDINWSGLSTSPTVTEGSVNQDLFTDEVDLLGNKSDFADDEFSFLNQLKDDRVFKNFKAKIKVLNKHTDQISYVELTAEDSITLFKYSVSIGSCAESKINESDSQLAFLEVKKQEQVIFNGWVNNTYPSFNYPELPEYNIQLVSCIKIEE